MDNNIIEERIKRYAEWRKEHNCPQFEPKNGICWHCHRQIFEKCDGAQSITGCPFCNRTYVE